MWWEWSRHHGGDQGLAIASSGPPSTLMLPLSDFTCVEMSAVDKQVEINKAPRVVSDWHLTDTHQEKLSFSAVAPVDIQIRRLSVKVNAGHQSRLVKNQSVDEEAAGVSKSLLTQLDADFPRASLTGIIGSSGSGKTTLLDVLSR